MGLGLLDADMLRSLDRPDRLAAMAEQVPLRRVGAPPDLVGTAICLASPASVYVTGTVLTVDGGLTTG